MTAQRATLWVMLLVASTTVAAPTEQKPPPEMAPPDLDAAQSAPAMLTPNKGYRMQGLYGFGTKPFYLERDPVTGAFDFSGASAGSSEPAHKFSSKVPAHADYDYEEVAIDTDPIDRKDTLGPIRPNDLEQPSHKSSKVPQVPLISSSYASTKLQGTGAVKEQATTTTTTAAPSYYFSTWPTAESTTTKKLLDFWPPAKPSSETPEYYDYEEISAEVSEAHPQDNHPLHPHHHSVDPSTVVPPTTLPPFEYDPSEESETARPIPPKKKQDTVKKPEKPEFPNQPPTPEIEIQPPVEVNYKEPELELTPPEIETRPDFGDVRPHNAPAEVRPPDLEMRPPQVEFRPPVSDVRPLETEMRPPFPGAPFRAPQGVPLPPRYAPERPILDSQGWQQAQTPPPSSPTFSSTRVTFPDSTPPPISSPGPYRQNLPPGYEPKRPIHPFRDQQRPPFRRPPQENPYTFVQAKPIDRHHVENRPPPPLRFRPQQKVGGVRNRNDDSLPNILPQFRPNLRPDNSEYYMFRQHAGGPPPQQPPPFKRFPPQGHHGPNQGPPNQGPPVGRRVGPEVATLQMMKGAMIKNAPRVESPLPQPPPSHPLMENKPPAPEERPAERPSTPGVYVVYPNANQNDIHVGQQGSSRPLPPNQLHQAEQPILPGKTDFPYALEKPIDRHDGPSFSIKHKNKVSVVPQTGDRSEITVSAIMHAGPDGGHSGSTQGQVFVVNPQHRPEVHTADVITSHHRVTQPEAVAPSPPESFQAPFHASANVAPSHGNGWTAIRDSEFRPQGIVERADHDVPEPSQEPAASKFDIENFTPQLIGGFQPILPSADSSAPKKEVEETKVELKTTDRQERKHF
ncbi:uncharacterized protein LOC132193165 [Neocloeon triangulifer]|uniref:uncharacterized protein LOC132193165 n=1 Tax=Neocloeon triangulifer TaxID=2078957 RepID=UPI00286F18FC|nr:uncharacterized protein LOC132193165 [Neocloeon triangulifer]